MTDTAFAKVTIPSPYFVFVKVKSLATNDGELMGQKKSHFDLGIGLSNHRKEQK